MCFTMSMYNVGRGSQGGLYNTEKQVVIVQCLTILMDSDCNGVCAGIFVMGESSKHNFTHVILYIYDRKIDRQADRWKDK